MIRCLLVLLVWIGWVAGGSCTACGEAGDKLKTSKSCTCGLIVVLWWTEGERGRVCERACKTTGVGLLACLVRNASSFAPQRSNRGGRAAHF